jgi:S-methylmethionine-dependent homocysteine/selenocysteine methylase
LTGINA